MDKDEQIAALQAEVADLKQILLDNDILIDEVIDQRIREYQNEQAFAARRIAELEERKNAGTVKLSGGSMGGEQSDPKRPEG